MDAKEKLELKQKKLSRAQSQRMASEMAAELLKDFRNATTPKARLAIARTMDSLLKNYCTSIRNEELEALRKRVLAMEKER